MMPLFIRKFFRLLWIMALMALSAAPSAWACVGKVLDIGVIGRPEEKILSRILSVLVNERTGTSVKIREYGDFNGGFIALAKGDIDLMVAFAGQGYAELMGKKKGISAEKIIEETRKAFNENHNLIWLEPWGVSDGGRFLMDEAEKGLATQAAPLVRKDTLKEFPALARLINKMAGRLNDSTMASLVKKAETNDPDRVVRDYLKSEKLI